MVLALLLLVLQAGQAVALLEVEPLVLPHLLGRETRAE